MLKGAARVATYKQLNEDLEDEYSDIQGMLRAELWGMTEFNRTMFYSVPDFQFVVQICTHCQLNTYLGYLQSTMNNLEKKRKWLLSDPDPPVLEEIEQAAARHLVSIFDFNTFVPGEHYPFEEIEKRWQIIAYMNFLIRDYYADFSPDI